MSWRHRVLDTVYLEVTEYCLECHEPFTVLAAQRAGRTPIPVLHLCDACMTGVLALDALAS